MQKRLCFMALALLMCNALFAQEENWSWGDDPIANRDKSYRIEIGPKVGIGMAMGTNPTVYEFDFKNGMAYQVGGAANMHFGRRRLQSPGGTGFFGVEVEVLYGNRNIRTPMGKLTMHCLEIPILFQFYPIPSLAIEAGLTIVSTLKCSPNLLQFNDVVFHLGQMSGSDVMITFGACYKAPPYLLFDLRYNIGTSVLANNFDSKISSFMFSTTYLFSLNNK